MTEEDAIKVEGVVSETLPNAMFRVKLRNGWVAEGDIRSLSRSQSNRIRPGVHVVVRLAADRGRASIIAVK